MLNLTQEQIKFLCKLLYDIGNSDCDFYNKNSEMIDNLLDILEHEKRQL